MYAPRGRSKRFEHVAVLRCADLWPLRCPVLTFHVFLLVRKRKRVWLTWCELVLAALLVSYPFSIQLRNNWPPDIISKVLVGFGVCLCQQFVAMALRAKPRQRLGGRIFTDVYLGDKAGTKSTYGRRFAVFVRRGSLSPYLHSTDRRDN